jgi:hypothetical protein
VEAVRRTRVPARALSAGAVAVAAVVAALGTASHAGAAVPGVLGVMLLASRRPTAARCGLLALVAAVALAGAGPLSWLAAPGLVICAELAFDGAEMRAAPVEDAGLLRARLAVAATVTAAAGLTTALVAGLAAAPLPGGAIVTVAGLLAAAAASTLVGVRSRR